VAIPFFFFSFFFFGNTAPLEDQFGVAFELDIHVQRLDNCFKHQISPFNNRMTPKYSNGGWFLAFFFPPSGNVYLGRGAELAFNAVGQLNVTSGCLSVNSTAAALVINIRNAFDLLDFIKTTPTLIKFDTACAVQTLPTFQTVVTLPCVTLTPSCQTGVGCKIDYTTSTDCAPPVAGNFIRFVVNFNVSSIIDVQKISSTINSIRDTLADFFPGLDIEDFANLDLQPIVANATTYIASLDVPEPPALLRSFINTFGIDGLILRTLIGDAVSTVLGGLGVEVNSISSQDYDTPSAAAMAIPQLAIILATAGTALFGMRFF
jgi:hypothetical protein